MTIEQHFILVLTILGLIICFLYTWDCNAVFKIGDSGNTKLDEMPIWQCPEENNKFSRISKIFDMNKTGQSMGLFDKWSFTHITHGYILFAFLYYLNNYKKSVGLFYTALALEIYWEIFENQGSVIKQYRNLRNLYRDYVGDSLVNIISDILFNTIGLILAWYLPMYINLIIIILLELVAYYTINDSVMITALAAIIKLITYMMTMSKMCYNKGFQKCFTKVREKVKEKFHEKLTKARYYIN